MALGKFARSAIQHENQKEAEKTIRRELKKQQQQEEKRKIFGVKLEESLIEEVKEAAQQNGIKIQFFVEAALKEHLKKF